MHASNGPDRREFFQAAAVSTVLPAILSAAEVPAKKAKIRVGCLGWCFHNFGAVNTPAQEAAIDNAIDTIGEIGFDGIELILTARGDIEHYWNDANLAKLTKRLEKNKLQVSQFVVFQPVVEGLSSVNKEERNKNLDYFEAGCKIGKALGAPMINIVAPWARELKGPTNYLPRYYEIPQPKEGERFHIDIAESFDWEKVWDAYVESTKGCLERVKHHGLKMSLEHHTHTLVPDAPAFVQLWQAVRDPALGYNLDTGWAQLQREYPPLAVHKVKGHLFNVHMRDIDGFMRQFVHVGTGVMDFPGIVEALKRTSFEGFVSIEQDKHPGEMKETCRRYLKMMRDLVG
jgi:sugar phosphate isomerase/epimerase